MHVYLAAACPQCRSTTMVAANQDDAWGKDHAINCGVYSRRVISAGLTRKGLQWHGSMDPEVWANKLWWFRLLLGYALPRFWWKLLSRRDQHQKPNGRNL